MNTPTSTSPLLGAHTNTTSEVDQKQPIAPTGSYRVYQFNSLGTRPERRFACIKIYLFHLLVWSLFATLLLRQPILKVFHSNHSSKEIMDEAFPGMPLFSLDDHPDIDVSCVSGDQWDYDASTSATANYTPYTATTSFELPVDSPHLLFLARGSYASGHVEVVSGEPSDKVRVDVEARYWSRSALDRARVCRFHYTDGSHDGVGIFTPRSRHSHHQRENLFFLLTIHIPSHASLPRHIESFSTYLALFSQEVHNLTNSIEFGELSLRVTNKYILVKDVRARDVRAQTTNGAISGSYNTSSSLVLTTSNAPIKVDVTAYNEGGVVKADLATSNSVLEVNFSLYASQDLNAPASFDIKTHTTNAPLRANYLESPPDSVLSAKSSTTNSPASVQLHPAYEGSFTATTTLFNPNIERLNDVEDPTGRGRTRSVNYNFVTRGIATGTVAWVPSDYERGHPGSVIVSTTNGHLYLTV